VISNKMDKTVVVKVERLVHHPKYHKFIRRQNKFMAHDAQNACRVGDQVLIEESRPLSKAKRWVVVRTLEKAVM
jgi:small subunit ribosomal protein S17